MLWEIILGGIAGWLAGKIMRGAGYGILIDILLGLAGGWVGGWIASMLGIPIYSYFLTALLGSILLVWLSRRF
jgi:uncharacterized membrane protein YeaQ/YmgE (transglycosylase-associated protein family)